VEDVAFHGIGGLIGYLGGYLNNSYATGVVRGFAEIGGLVGSLGGGGPYISNSHASGDVYGEEFVGGLVGYLDNVSQSISNAYATGDVTGLSYVGGLTGASYGYIQNSYATGYVTGDDKFDNFIGFKGGSFFIDGISRAFSKSSPDAPSILSVVNTAGGIAGAPAFEIVACKNSGLPLLSTLIASYTNTCTPNPAPASLSAALASAVQLNPKFNLLESTTLRLFLYLVGDKSIRITVEDFVVLGATGVNSKNLPVLLKLLKNVDLLTLDLNTINENVKIANELLKKQKKK
jgi:hypothetical protein